MWQMGKIGISALGSSPATTYHKQDNKSAAQQLVVRIFSAVGMLTRHPLTGREGRVKGTRELAIAQAPYIIAYRIHRDEIQILAALHGAQRWPTAFITN